VSIWRPEHPENEIARQVIGAPQVVFKVYDFGVVRIIPDST